MNRKKVDMQKGIKTMTFTDLKYFLALAEELNFSHCAEKLFVSQQALSARIARLEREYTTEFFNRTPTLSLTPAGNCFAQNARLLLQQAAQMECELQDMKNFENSSLTVAILSDRGTAVFPRIFKQFRQEFPGIRLHVVEINRRQIAEILESGAADLAIGFSFESDTVQSFPICPESFLLMVPKNLLDAYFTPEQQQGLLEDEKLPLEYFCHLPFLAYSQSTWLKDIFEACCLELHVQPNIVMETSNFMTRFAMCSAGLGMMFVSHSFISDIPLVNPAYLNGVRIFQIDNPDFYRDICVNIPRRGYRSQACREFLRIARHI
ncbi:MAG: LysR family transcriptional regulator [Lachnospiraceae bacterium]|nr:LysR family transcriptional regulator [Lachnospiraceae bacterium]